MSCIARWPLLMNHVDILRRRLPTISLSKLICLRDDLPHASSNILFRVIDIPAPTILRKLLRTQLHQPSIAPGTLVRPSTRLNLNDLPHSLGIDPVLINVGLNHSLIWPEVLRHYPNLGILICPPPPASADINAISANSNTITQIPCFIRSGIG